MGSTVPTQINMADTKENTTAPTSIKPEVTQSAGEPKTVEQAVQIEQNPSPPPATKSAAPETQHTQAADELSQLTPAIVQALCFDSSNKTEQELRAHNANLQTLLGKVIELLKEKSGLCSNLEKQNNALMLQANSLKDVVAITKDLLSIRNMEVEHLHVDIKSLEEKINIERDRHNNMLNRMSETIKLNDNLKAEYQSQLTLFNELRVRYEQKVALLEAENKRLTNQKSNTEPETVSDAGTIEKTGEGDVQISTESKPPA